MTKTITQTILSIAQDRLCFQEESMVNASEVTKKLVTRLKGQIGLSPIEKPLLVSACFVALLDRTFCSNRETYNGKTELPGSIIQSVRKQHVCRGITGDQIKVIDGSYEFISLGANIN